MLPDDSRRLLVIPGKVTVHNLAKTNQCLAKEVEERNLRKVFYNTSLIKQAVQALTADINDKEVELNRPLSKILQDIRYNHFDL